MFSKVISYFNDINRVADALGLEPEPDPDLSGRTLAEEPRAIKVVKGRLPRQSAIVISTAEIFISSIINNMLASFVVPWPSRPACEIHEPDRHSGLLLAAPPRAKRSSSQLLRIAALGEKAGPTHPGRSRFRT